MTGNLKCEVVSVAERIQALQKSSAQEQIKFFEDDGWNLLRNWIQHSRKSENRILLHLILNFMLTVPDVSVLPSLKEEKSEISKILDGIIQKELRSKWIESGKETRLLCDQLLSKWNHLLEKRDSTESRMKLLPIRFKVTCGDGKTMFLQPTEEKVWWAMTVDGKTSFVRMKETYWKYLTDQPDRIPQPVVIPSSLNNETAPTTSQQDNSSSEKPGNSGEPLARRPSEDKSETVNREELRSKLCQKLAQFRQLRCLPPMPLSMKFKRTHSGSQLKPVSNSGHVKNVKPRKKIEEPKKLTRPTAKILPTQRRPSETVKKTPATAMKPVSASPPPPSSKPTSDVRSVSPPFTCASEHQITSSLNSKEVPTTNELALNTDQKPVLTQFTDDINPPVVMNVKEWEMGDDDDDVVALEDPRSHPWKLYKILFRPQHKRCRRNQLMELDEAYKIDEDERLIAEAFPWNTATTAISLHESVDSPGEPHLESDRCPTQLPYAAIAKFSCIDQYRTRIFDCSSKIWPTPKADDVKKPVRIINCFHYLFPKKEIKPIETVDLVDDSMEERNSKPEHRQSSCTIVRVPSLPAVRSLTTSSIPEVYQCINVSTAEDSALSIQPERSFLTPTSVSAPGHEETISLRPTTPASPSQHSPIFQFPTWPNFQTRATFLPVIPPCPPVNPPIYPPLPFDNHEATPPPPPPPQNFEEENEEDSPRAVGNNTGVTTEQVSNIRPLLQLNMIPLPRPTTNSPVVQNAHGFLPTPTPLMGASTSSTVSYSSNSQQHARLFHSHNMGSYSSSESALMPPPPRPRPRPPPPSQRYHRPILPVPQNYNPFENPPLPPWQNFQGTRNPHFHPPRPATYPTTNQHHYNSATFNTSPYYFAPPQLPPRNNRLGYWEF